MSVPTTDSAKRSSAQDAVRVAFNAAGQIQAAYWAVNATSYSNKATVLTAIDTLYDAYLAAVSATDGLS